MQAMTLIITFQKEQDRLQVNNKDSFHKLLMIFEV